MRVTAALSVATFLICSVGIGSSTQTGGPPDGVQSTLEGFVADFRADPYAEDLHTAFGIEIEEVGESSRSTAPTPSS